MISYYVTPETTGYAVRCLNDNEPGFPNRTFKIGQYCKHQDAQLRAELLNEGEARRQVRLSSDIDDAKRLLTALQDHYEMVRARRRTDNMKFIRRDDGLWAAREKLKDLRADAFGREQLDFWYRQYVVVAWEDFGPQSVLTKFRVVCVKDSIVQCVQWAQTMREAGPQAELWLLRADGSLVKKL